MGLLSCALWLREALCVWLLRAGTGTKRGESDMGGEPASLERYVDPNDSSPERCRLRQIHAVVGVVSTLARVAGRTDVKRTPARPNLRATATSGLSSAVPSPHC